MLKEHGISRKQKMAVAEHKPRRKKASKTIAFRVDPEIDRRLRELSAAGGMDLSDYMREMVRRHLDHVAPPTDALAELERKTDILHRDLAQSVRALLAVVAHLVPADASLRERSKRHATEWVRANLGVKQ